MPWSERPPRRQVPRALRLRVLARDGWLCQADVPGVCTVQATEAGHILRQADGGLETEDNLRAECSACNAWRNQREIVRATNRAPIEQHPPI